MRPGVPYIFFDARPERCQDRGCEDALVHRVHLVDAQRVSPNKRPAREQWAAVSGNGFCQRAPEQKLKWVLGNVHDAPVGTSDARFKSLATPQLQFKNVKGPFILVDACRTTDTQGGVRVGPEMRLGHSFRKRRTRLRGYLCLSGPAIATACETWVLMVCPCGKSQGCAQTRPSRRSLGPAQL